MLSTTMRLLTLLGFLIVSCHSFLAPPPRVAEQQQQRQQQRTLTSSLSAEEREEQDDDEVTTVQIEATLDDEKVTKLFAWVSRAFAGDGRYNDLMLALAAVFGNLPALEPMVQEAMELLPEDAENTVCGASYSLEAREEASLGAMGAAQWTGAWKTRPHAIMDISHFESVEDWIKTLPRGCRRTIQNKALVQNFTIASKPIVPSQAAPHSSLAHFRCVMEHEVRLLAYSPQGFFDALSVGVSRYIGTTRMVGEIQEYRDAESGKVLGFAHEVRKGNVIRGQWFYGTDEASQRYVWFRSVYEVVKRAIATDGIDIVDLGPSGSDAFSELKAKYGFVSVDEWTEVADYTGAFWYDDVKTQLESDELSRMRLYEY